MKGVYTMKKILPMVYPPVTGYSHQAYLMSILMGHEECLPWVYSNYIQIFTLKNLYAQKDRIGAGDFFYNYYGDWHFYELKTCPWISYQSIPYKLAFSHQNIHQFLYNALDSDNYVKICVDMGKISAYGMLGEHENHDMLIYGYDDASQEYYAADNFKNGKYKFVRVPYNEVEHATYPVIYDNLCNELFKDNITCLKFETCYNQTPELLRLNLNKIINDLKEYLLEEGYAEAYKDSEYYVFGVDYYAEMIKYYEKVSLNGEPIDVRTMATFRDHKRLMCQRIEYLEANDSLSEKTKCLKHYMFIRDEMENIWYLLLLYNMKLDAQNIVSLIKRLKKVKAIERELLQEVLMELTNKLPFKVNRVLTSE